jgi:hypothetical protein
MRARASRARKILITLPTEFDRIILTIECKIIASHLQVSRLGN